MKTLLMGCFQIMVEFEGHYCWIDGLRESPTRFWKFRRQIRSLFMSFHNTSLSVFSAGQLLCVSTRQNRYQPHMLHTLDMMYRSTFTITAFAVNNVFVQQLFTDVLRVLQCKTSPQKCSCGAFKNACLKIGFVVASRSTFVMVL